MKRKIAIFLSIIAVALFPMTAFASAQSNQSTDLYVAENGVVMQSFALANLMPGDTLYQTFDLVLTHENDAKVTLYFAPDDTASAALLAALQITVYMPQVDRVLFEGRLEDFVQSGEYLYVESGSTGTSTVNYEVTFSLPTTAGNECMGVQIDGAFIWQSEEVESVPAASDTTNDDIVLYAPATGEGIGYLIAFAVLVGSGLLLFVLVRKGKKSKKTEIVTTVLFSFSLLMVLSVAVMALVVKSTVLDSVISTGIIDINFNDGRVVFSPDDLQLKAGDSVAKDVFVENEGTEAFYYRVYLDKLSGELVGCTTINIYDDTGSLLFSAAAADINARNYFTTGEIVEAGERVDFTIEVVFAQDAGNTYQGGTLAFDIVASAIQSKNNTEVS